jgi:hypothetical protein
MLNERGAQHRGHTGETYDYFICIGRHTGRTECNLPYASVEAVEEAIENYYDTIVLGEDTVGVIQDRLLKVAKRRNAAAERAARRARKRILDLEGERRKLLHAHLAGAVPVDLLKEEQHRITTELANAGAALANTEVHWERLAANLKAALELTTRIGDAYRAASPTVRRHFNQAILEGVFIDVDGGIAYTRLAQPFKGLLDEDFLARLALEMKNPSPDSQDRGSNMGLLVEVMGLEPTNLLTASHILGVREGSASAATGALPGTIVQSRSDPFSGIRPRCLHNCLHFESPRLRASRAPEGILFREVPDPFTNELDRCGPRVSGWHCRRTVRRGGRGILDSWLRNR